MAEDRQLQRKSKPELIEELTLSQRKIQLLENAFDDFIDELEFSKKQIRTAQANREQIIETVLDDLIDELRFTKKQVQILEGSLGEAIASTFQGEQRGQTSAALVEVMTLTLEYWQTTTGKSKVDLAEESQLWRVYIDQSVFRTRTLDKYLDVKTLPKHPRWRDVLRTARYVLAAAPTEASVPLRQSLEGAMTRLNALLRQATTSEKSSFPSPVSAQFNQF